MKATGIVRRIDDLEGVVITKIGGNSGGDRRVCNNTY